MAKRKSEWQNNYIARTYDRVNLVVPKGRKAEIQAYAEIKGESLNGFINRVINEAMESENAKKPSP